MCTTHQYLYAVAHAYDISLFMLCNIHVYDIPIFMIYLYDVYYACLQHTCVSTQPMPPTWTSVCMLSYYWALTIMLMIITYFWALIIMLMILLGAYYNDNKTTTNIRISFNAVLSKNQYHTTL